MKFLRSLREPKIVSGRIAQHCISRVLIADSFGARMRGWYGYQSTSNQGRGIDGVLLTVTSSVQTIGMGFALDLIWLDDDLRCVDLSRRVPPWRVCWCIHASHVLELASTSDNHALLRECQPGQQLQLIGRAMYNPGKEA